jgi:hypothetical protein
MPRRFRLLIVLLVALTVPLQGIAAVTAGVCMALGHHGAGDAAPAEHGHADGATHEQHGSQSDDSGSAHCPPCVACCVAAVIAPAIAIFIPAPPVGSVLPAATAFVSGVTPDKLDRPPLSL